MLRTLHVVSLGRERSRATGSLELTAAALLWSACGGTSVTPHPDGSSASATRHSVALAISDHGVIAGSGSDAEGQSRALLFQAGGAAGTYSVTDVGTLGGATSEIHGLSASGKATGMAATAGGQTHAFLYEGGPLIDLGVLAGGDTFSRGQAVNDAGLVVGSAGTTADAGLQRAFVRRPGEGLVAAITPGPLLANSTLLGMNAAGQLIGWSMTTGDKFSHAFLTTVAGPSVDLTALLTDIEHRGVVVPHGLRVNDAGRCLIAGIVSGASTFAYPGGTGLVSLPSTSGLGFILVEDLNNDGDVVGGERVGAAYGEGPEEAALWRGGQETLLGFHGDPGVVDLNDRISVADQARYTLTAARTMNTAGQIGCDTAGGHAVILSPL